MRVHQNVMKHNYNILNQRTILDLVNFKIYERLETCLLYSMKIFLMIFFLGAIMTN